MGIEEQVRLAVKGDEKAFEYLMDIYKDGLYRTAFAYVKNEQNALDILQETVYKAYISIGTLREAKYFKTWITRILINNANYFLGKEKKLVYISDEIQNNQNCSEGTKIDEKLDILAAIDKLNPKYKNIVILKYFQDLTITEISQALDCPAGTVKTYLNKALSKLRLLMNEEIG